MSDVIKMDQFLRNEGVKIKQHRRTLLEAYRRNFMFNKKELFQGAWLGLGMPSCYNNKYFRTHDGNKTPRISHWWVLTKDGEEIFGKLLKKFPIPKKIKSRNNLNTSIFNF